MIFWKKLKAGTVGLALVMASASTAQEKVLRADTIGAGSVPAIMMVTLTELVQKNTDMRFQVSTGKPATRSAVDAANGQVQIYSGAPTVSYYLQNQISMYKEMDNAAELANRIRSIVNFPFGTYHVVVWEDSDIKEMKDLVGKRLFIGPPGSAAVRTSTAMLEAVGNFKAGEDYTTANLDWTGGLQAFQDRDVAAYFMPSAVPAAQFQQLASMGKIRFLGLSDKVIASDKIQALLQFPGRAIETLEVGTYGPNQMNEEAILSIGTWGSLDTTTAMDEDAIYQITKVFWDNIDSFYAASKALEIITPETAFTYMATPLHAGAVRYYREAGYDIPANLIPPEAD